MKTPRIQSRRWLFTLNNYTDAELAALNNDTFEYVIAGKEVAPTTNTPHLQGYVLFKNNKSLLAVRKLMPRAHWETAKGTSDENITYCSKDGDFVEYGVRPKSKAQLAADVSERQTARWKAVIAAAKEGTCEEQFPGEFIRYNSTIKRLLNRALPDISDYSGIWYYGPPGSGKSRTARQNYPVFYDKLINKWWDNYEDEESVIIDDISMDHGFMGSYLKRWADHYPFRAEFKGGSMMIRPKNIIVTSNYTPAGIWPDDNMLVMAIQRRFKLVMIDLPQLTPPPAYGGYR